MVYELPLLKGQPIQNPVQGGKLDTFVAAISFGELAKRYQIPHRVHSTDDGYQRMPRRNRVRQLARDLRAGAVDLPTAVLLSVRDRSLSPMRQASAHYLLTIPDNSARPFYVVDGQHRLEALSLALREEPDAGWSNFMVHAVIMFGATEDVEMDQFHIVNSNAKSISSDLALDLLKVRASKNASFRRYLVESGDLWKIEAQEITELVSQRTAWTGKIRFPNDKKGYTLIGSNAFVSSLKRPLQQEVFATYKQLERARIIDAYWQGILRVLTECKVTPRQYSLQKTVGTWILNFILPRLLAHAQATGQPVDSPATYEFLLRDTLNGFSGANRHGGIVEGDEFWKSGEAGAAGVYSSYTGRQVLTDKLMTELDSYLS